MQHQPLKFRFFFGCFFSAAIFLSAFFSGCMSKKTEAFLREVTSENQEEVSDIVPEEPVISDRAADITEAVITPRLIFIDVEGAVKNPGVQSLPEGSRVFQAIGAAGGFLPEAAGSAVNQAGILLDGQQIYVPTFDEITRMEEQSFSSRAAVMAGHADLLNDGPLKEPEKVNLNTASMEELMTITGIGEAKARAIIAYREAHGAFQSETELMQVEGIKEGTFEKIKNQITIR